MTVQEFLIYFRKDIPESNILDWNFQDYENWHPFLLKLTSQFHKKVKQSYFDQTIKLIENDDFQKYYGIGNLSEFAYLGLFTDEDELSFCVLIRNLTNKLDKTENESEIKNTLNFIYSLSDFLFHEYYPDKESELRKVLIELKIKINEKRKFDIENIGELIIRFIDLMI